MSGGNRSGRTAAHWPHLMKAQPARPSVHVSRRYQARRAAGTHDASGASTSSGAKMSTSAQPRGSSSSAVGAGSTASAASASGGKT